MKKTYSIIMILTGLLHYAQTVPPIFNGQDSDLSGVNENYTYTRNYLEPTTVSNPQAKQIQSILFFDGLGKPNQNIMIHASPTGNDLVTHIPYDGFGRQVENWLPVPMNSLNGNIQIPPSTSGYYKTSSGSGDALIYGKQNLENSPLDRLQSYAGPGSDWSGKLASYNYQTNNNVEAYKFTTTTTLNNGIISSVLNSQLINYPEGTLYKTITTDEDGHEVTEFKNEQGQTLLTRKKEGFSYLSTYYVYNEYNQLAFVIPPLATQKIVANNGVTPDILAGLIYQYRYDGWNRLVESKPPGIDWKYMVYDQMDRLVMSQDINLRSQGKWLFTKYDTFGRIAYTGLLNSSGDRLAQQAVINTNPGETRSSSGFTDLGGSTIYYTNGNTYPQTNMTVLKVNYYDTYPPGSPTGSSAVVTQDNILASFIKNIEDNRWTKKFIYYDEKGRAIAEHSVNYLGGYTKTEFKLSFSGAPLNILTHHKKDINSQEITINEFFTYDHQDRMIRHTHQINGAAQETLAEYVYNELGQLQNKNVGNGIQSLAYRYNTRGALTHVNDPNNLNNKLFGFELKYTNPKNSIPSYNGNIAEVDWATKSDGVLRRYSYEYDQSNRLESAVYRKPNSTVIATNAYNEKATYDANGNIQTFLRFGGSDGNSAVKIDDITYTYDGNKIVDVWDSSGNSLGLDGGDAMSYDANGNLIEDGAHLIDHIGYNHLNLPNLIEKQVENFQYYYSADGTKLQAVHNETEINKVTVTGYLDGFQYKNGELQLVPTSEGYYDFITNKYIYNYTDHLGNVRLSYLSKASGIGIIEEKNYYPFGLKHQGYNELGESDYKYGYLGNELQETGMYDMNARFYMPELGRFMQHDPVSSLSLDPYGYAFNNPITFKDPSGLLGESTKCPPDCSIPPNSPGGDNNPYPIQEVVLSGNPGGGYLPFGFYFSPWGGYGYGDYSGGSNSTGYTSNITNSPGENPLAWFGTRSLPYSTKEVDLPGFVGNAGSSALNWIQGHPKAFTAIVGTVEGSSQLVAWGIKKWNAPSSIVKSRIIAETISTRLPASARVLGVTSKGLNVLGKTVGAVGLINTAYQYQQGNITGIRATADAVMGVVGFLGPWGAGASLVYFGGMAIYETNFNNGKALF